MGYKPNPDYFYEDKDYEAEKKKAEDQEISKENVIKERNKLINLLREQFNND